MVMMGNDDDWLGWETARFIKKGGGDARWTQVYTRDALVLA